MSEDCAYEPPVTVSNDMIDLVAQASYELGRAVAVLRAERSVYLRRENRIRTVHSSLAIEHNTLTLGQVTAILDGKRVLGDPREIREVENAFAAYDLLTSVDPFSIDELLQAHGLMMDGLVPEAGRFRSEGVGVFDGDRLVHMAPPARLVPDHVANLFAWYAASPLHPLIKSAVFHYEFEFIHPFQDGNGRIGRMWHTVLLGAWNPVFFWLPVEELIQKNQQGYYDVLGSADAQADSSGFVLFMLRLFVEALKEAGDGNVSSDKLGVESDKRTNLILEHDDLEVKRTDSSQKSDDLHVKHNDSALKRDDSHIKCTDSSGADLGVHHGDKNGFNVPTLQNINELRRRLSNADHFGRSDVIAVIGGSDSRAGKLLKKMLDVGIVEQVKGHGKGRYRFKESQTK